MSESANQRPGLWKLTNKRSAKIWLNVTNILRRRREIELCFDITGRGITAWFHGAWRSKYCEGIYFCIYLLLCNPIPLRCLSVADTKWCCLLFSETLNIHGHTDPGIFHLFTSDHGPPSQMASDEAAAAEPSLLLLVRSCNPRLWLATGDPCVSALTLHVSSDVIINYWCWALLRLRYGLCTPPWHSPPDPLIGPLWGSWETGN